MSTWNEPQKARRNWRRGTAETPAFNPYIREQLAEQRRLAFEEIGETVPKPWYAALWAVIISLFVKG